MRPLIGITAALLREAPNRDWVYNTSDYFRAVQQAGGIPVLLPFCESEADAAAILDRLDGLLLSGGSDIDPQLFGEQPHPKMGAITPERDTTELAMARLALQRDMPVLGICRGQQLLAVAAGGTLFQDIPAQVPEAIRHHHQSDTPKWYATHSVAVTEGTRLAAAMGPTFRVNSRHHQAVKDMPAGWVISAIAADGIIEAMEHPGHRFALAVQWHPENFTGQPFHFGPLFAAFVAACQGNTLNVEESEQWQPSL